MTRKVEENDQLKMMNHQWRAAVDSFSIFEFNYGARGENAFIKKPPFALFGVFGGRKNPRFTKNAVIV